MPSWDHLDWHRCEEVFHNATAIPQSPGAYAIRCAPQGKIAVIGRVFGPDKTGILCFGRTAERTEGLRGRLTDFWRATGGMLAPHAEGRRYHSLCYGMKGFARDTLEVGWETGGSSEARQQEAAWFCEYLAAFGELPPLNRKQG